MTKWKTTLSTVLTISATASTALLMKIRRDSLVESLLKAMEEKDRRYEHLTTTLLSVPPASPPPTVKQFSESERDKWTSPEPKLGTLPIDEEWLRQMEEESGQVMSSSTRQYPGVEQIVPGLTTLNLQNESES